MWIMDAQNSAKKQRGRPFKPGQSGNPAGKPKGARNRATLAAEALLDGEAQALTRKAIEMALAGDPTAMRLCLERILSPRKDRPLSLELPPIANADDAAEAIRSILSAVAQGRLTISEGREFSSSVFVSYGYHSLPTRTEVASASLGSM